MQNNSIQVKGLQKSYKQLHVLKSVDFEVEKGSIFALLGSNGAGKTTIVKILTTLLKQDSGTAAVRVEMNLDPFRGSIPPETYELPLRKQDGAWRVHVQGVNRAFFPFLPH